MKFSSRMREIVAAIADLRSLSPPQQKAKIRENSGDFGGFVGSFGRRQPAKTEGWAGWGMENGYVARRGGLGTGVSMSRVLHFPLLRTVAAQAHVRAISAYLVMFLSFLPYLN